MKTLYYNQSVSFCLKVISSIIFTILTCSVSMGQTANDVLMDGIRAKQGEKIFLSFEGGVLKYDLTATQSIPPNFINLKDSTIFLSSGSAIKVYIKPLNPLNFTFNSENKEIVDPIDKTAATAFGGIIDVLNTTKTVAKVSTKGTDGKMSTYSQIVWDTCQTFLNIESNLKNFQTKLKQDKKSDVVKIFTKLEALTFNTEAATLSKIDELKKETDALSSYYSDIRKISEYLNGKIAAYQCDKPSGFLTKYLFDIILRDLNSALEEQEKRVKNLNAALNLVMDTYDKASQNGWYLPLNDVPSNLGKITLTTVSIKENGYNLSNKASDKDEIVSVETKTILQKTLRIRRFQRFVPEVSVGAVYTFFEYNTYGTISDATGQQYVAAPVSNSIRNLNVAAMINFNFFLNNSSIHPLYQIGAGVNSGIPTLLTGIGLRSNILGIKRIAIAGGVAMTWIKELDKLKPNAKISGTSDIENDLKYQLIFPPKPYIALQYNF